MWLFGVFLCLKSSFLDFYQEKLSFNADIKMLYCTKLPLLTKPIFFFKSWDDKKKSCGQTFIYFYLTYMKNLFLISSRFYKPNLVGVFNKCDFLQKAFQYLRMKKVFSWWKSKNNVSRHEKTFWVKNCFDILSV